MNKDEVIKALSALAHPKRLDVFRLLVVAGSEGTTPGVLMEQLQVPSATMSLYLKELTAAGLVTQERAGRNVIYRAVYESMDGVVAFLTENCCKGLAKSKKPETADAWGCSAPGRKD